MGFFFGNFCDVTDGCVYLNFLLFGALSTTVPLLEKKVAELMETLDKKSSGSRVGEHTSVGGGGRVAL